MPSAPLKVKKIAIADDVAAILRNQLYFNDHEVRITGNRLDPKLYKRVNQILEALGGKWNRKAQAHIFPGVSREAIEAALADGKVLNAKQSFQFFETPEDLAQRMVNLADIDPGMTVLEPSAGRGAIAAVILDKSFDCKLTVLDLDPAHQAVLESLYESSNAVDSYDVLPPSDFLGVGPGGFDRIVMNPPFTGGQDIEHVRHAYSLLNSGGRIVAIMSPSGFNNSDKRSVGFRAWLSGLDHQIEELPAGTFKASGTNVVSMLVKINR